MDGIKSFLNMRFEKGLLRALHPASARKNGKITINGQEYLDFSSNDYLGLSGHPKIIAAAKSALDEFGASSSASRLLSGSLQLHSLLEQKVARFKNKEAALVFNSGYQANVGIISAILGESDAVFSDRLVHASIIDGIDLSHANLFRFRHNDTGHLKELLDKKRSSFKKALIVTESIFSMDGDKAPLKKLVELKDKYNCLLFVDEAHATGIFGKNGSGLVEEEGLSDKTDLIMGTFSKALGSFGAYLAASGEVVEYLINTCRSFIYSTSLPPAVIAANIASLKVVEEEPRRRIELLNCARAFRLQLQGKGFEVKGESQIVPVVIGEAGKAVELSQRLKDSGFWVMPVRPPTVPEGSSRLRFSLSYSHSAESLNKLIDDLVKNRV
jgi:8-amino-7-oxononanoate synthase